jgi:hypothetical protein
LLVFALCAVVWTRMRRETIAAPLPRNTVAVTPSESTESTDSTDSTAAQMDRAASMTDQRASAWLDSDEPPKED